MNERIKELFKRAGGKTSIHNLMSNPIQYREYNELWNDNIQKFAELIVAECADIALNHPAKLPSNDWKGVDVPLDTSNRIKQHFGVEG